MEYQASRPLLHDARWLEFGRVLGGSLPTLLLGQESSRMGRVVNKSVMLVLKTDPTGSIKHADTFHSPMTGIKKEISFLIACILELQ